MSTTTMRVLIVGGGRVGGRAAEILVGRGHDVIVIERDPAVADELSDAYVATVIAGDATRPSILTQADLDRVDVVAALTGRTGTNLAVCMAATRLEPEVETVMRADRGTGDEYDRFVDETIVPERAGARAAANAVERDVRHLESLTGEVEVAEVRVREGAPVAGRSLADVALPRGSLIVTGPDGDRIGGSETVLEPGRSYVVAMEPDVADEVFNLLRG
jgi:trk system potassium uptake protein TrkA